MNRLPAVTVETMIARRVRAGFREDDSRALLRDINTAHTGDNLALALVYNGFATVGQAGRYARGTRVVIRDGRIRVDIGRPAVSAYDADDLCRTCGKHVADPHQPPCPAAR